MKIHQLPEALSNKIAAGEVVERPASVVKELIENSIDAGSKWIKLELVEAGLQRIKVSDDGEGMSEADCLKSLLRHATSKIKHDTDLFHVKSLGFRGEALASIASVSHITVQSSRGEEAGTKLYLKGGKVISQDKSHARRGTEITVDNLFYNTPARLKYMKTIHTELSHITDLLNRFALAHPDIKFDVTHNQKNIFASSGRGDLLQAIATVYGMNVARNMINIQTETPDFEISGYISRPEITRSSRNYLTFIINGRYIKSPPLTYAIMRAYHTLLPIHRSPIVVLSIKMDPILVDVNVHPTKLEVRFSKEKELIDLVESLIKSEFKSHTLIPSVEKEYQPKQQTSQSKLQFENSVEKSQSIFDDTDINYHIEPIHHNQSSTKHAETTIKDQHEGNQNSQPTLIKEERLSEHSNRDTLDINERIPALYPIGQLRGTYILAQNDEGFYMIDQHAAQERIKYEFFNEKLGKPTEDLQTLLLPLMFDFTKDELLFIKQHMNELEQVGLIFEAFGEQTYAVRSYPRWFPSGYEEEIIRDMIEQIIQNGKINISHIREEVAILMACKGSIKANHYLNNTEMTRLLNDLRRTAEPFTCPHGRPVIVQFSNKEIEKMFKRIM